MSGAVVVSPVLLPPPRSAASLAEAMTATTDQSTVRRRWGLIMTINGDGTVNVDLAGVEIPNLRVVAGYQPTVGERVILDVVGTDMTVLGATGQSPRRFNRPTGDIEPTIRKTAKPDTLILNGQTVSRTTYARLFAWVQQEGLLTTPQAPNNLFGAGDGSTTFTLPDFRGRTVVGATDALPVGSKFGADSVGLTAAHMPTHTHTVSDHPAHTHTFTTSSVADHSHSVSVSNADHWHAMNATGDHAGHFNGSQFNAQAGPDLGLAAWNSGGTVRGYHGHETGVNTHGHSATANNSGGHSHNGTTAANSAQAHTIGSSGNASPTAVDVRQPSYSVNWLIWV